MLGGYDTTIVSDSSKMTYVSLMDTTYWSLPLYSSYYGSDSVSLSATRLILDTGTSYFYFQTSDFSTIYSKITSGKTCGYSTSGLRACYWTSASDFSDIKFQLGSYTYTFPTSSWINVRYGVNTLWEFYIE